MGQHLVATLARNAVAQCNLERKANRATSWSRTDECSKEIEFKTTGVLRKGQLVRCCEWVTHHAMRLEGRRMDVAVRLGLLHILELAAAVRTARLQDSSDGMSCRPHTCRLAS